VKARSEAEAGAGIDHADVSMGIRIQSAGRDPGELLRGQQGIVDDQRSYVSEESAVPRGDFA
jgi:hypothetical protein